jgi:hypothetical protein
MMRFPRISFLVATILAFLEANFALGQQAFHGRVDGDVYTDDIGVKSLIRRFGPCVCGPETRHRRAGCQLMIETEQSRIDYMTCDPSQPVPEVTAANRLSEPTAKLMADVYQQAVGTLPSGQADALINALRGRSVTGGSGGGFAAAGRAAASFAGAGNCTRHLYNRTPDFWSVALINAGFCKVDGTPGSIDGDYKTNVCMVPPNGSATLAYRNDARVGAKIAIVGKWSGGSYAQVFNLREVGCYITHSGNTGKAVLNDPGDGDVTVN